MNKGEYLKNVNGILSQKIETLSRYLWNGLLVEFSPSPVEYGLYIKCVEAAKRLHDSVADMIACINSLYMGLE